MGEISTRAVLRDVRFSYAHVWEPKEHESGDKSYSVAILIAKTGKWAKQNLDTVNAIIDALQEKVKAEPANKGKLPRGFKVILRDGDEEKEDDPVYSGHYFINASSKTAPQIVSTQKDETDKPKPITNQDDFYSGCYGNVSVNFFSYNKKGGVGIGCGLNNIQKTRDGEKLAGGSTAAHDFGDIEEDEDDFGGSPAGGSKAVSIDDL